MPEQTGKDRHSHTFSVIAVASTVPLLPLSIRPEGLLDKMATFFGLNGAAYEDVASALLDAKMYADKDDLIFVGGSTFVVAEVLP